MLGQLVDARFDAHIEVLPLHQWKHLNPKSDERKSCKLTNERLWKEMGNVRDGGVSCP